MIRVVRFLHEILTLAPRERGGPPRTRCPRLVDRARRTAVFGLAPESTLYRCRTRSVATDRESPSVCSRAPRTLGHRVGEGVVVQVGRGKEQGLEGAAVGGHGDLRQHTEPGF